LKTFNSLPTVPDRAFEGARDTGSEQKTPSKETIE
jgi:hypothetical protein